MNAPGAKESAQMSAFLQEQVNLQRSREIILKITETCWEQCISTDGKVIQARWSAAPALSHVTRSSRP